MNIQSFMEKNKLYFKETKPFLLMTFVIVKDRRWMLRALPHFRCKIQMESVPNSSDRFQTECRMEVWRQAPSSYTATQTVTKQSEPFFQSWYLLIDNWEENWRSSGIICISIMHVAGLILARGGSKGIPLKNLRKLKGTPLLLWALKSMIHCQGKHSIFNCQICSLISTLDHVGGKWIIAQHLCGKSIRLWFYMGVIRSPRNSEFGRREWSSDSPTVGRNLDRRGFFFVSRTGILG